MGAVRHGCGVCVRARDRPPPPPRAGHQYRLPGPHVRPPGARRDSQHRGPGPAPGGRERARLGALRGGAARRRRGDGQRVGPSRSVQPDLRP
eukprot:256134-Rhodomonas_salina.3